MNCDSLLDVLKNSNLIIAVAGATGHVGRKILEVLSEYGFPHTNVIALNSKKDGVINVSYGHFYVLPVLNIDCFDFNRVGLVIFALPPGVVGEYVDLVSGSKCFIIDTSFVYRMRENTPLIVSGVNNDKIKKGKDSRIISSPNPVVTQLVNILYPLNKINPIKRLVISTYQSTSNMGKRGMDELYSQTKQGYSGGSLYNDGAKRKDKVFFKRIAFNCLPQIGDLCDCGNTTEELSIVDEINKIMETDIKITTTCVNVPTFVGFSVSLNIEFENEVNLPVMDMVLRDTDGVGVVNMNNSARYITPLECVQEDMVFVSRVRVDNSVENGLSMWVVADNTRYGIALNIAGILASFISYIHCNEPCN